MHLSWPESTRLVASFASSAKLSNAGAHYAAMHYDPPGLNEEGRFSKTNVDESHLSKAGTNADRSANQEQRESK
jgi:hypothetical protein